MLTEITAETFGVDLDIVYATDRNFTGRPVYARPACYLNSEAADRLARARDLAAAIGLRLRIFDAFRPAEAQWKLWNHTPDATFLADPRRGSPHSMGAAVDLTLLDAASGQELDMGTGFDAMTPLSFHGSTEVPAIAQKNRFTLLGIMSAAGFDFYSKEWWHYQLFNARANWPVLSDSAAGTRMM